MKCITKQECLIELGKNLSLESLQILAEKSSKKDVEKKLKQFKAFI